MTNQPTTNQPINQHQPMNTTQLRAELNSLLLATCGNAQLRSEFSDSIADLRWQISKSKQANQTKK